jgi:pimeloyl-ACP methyl ester carboxylesterase
MPLFTWLILGALLLAASALAYGQYAAWLKRSYYEADASDEIHFVTTGDGARLALYRHRPRGDVRRREPVFFCHGLGASKYNLDFDETYSWARAYARAGFDAWVVDLRGAGASVPPRRWNWNFDDYATYDVSACIAHIRARTGAEKVHWVGHSMGGMLLYAYLGTVHPEWVRSGVAMGSPVRFQSKHGFHGALKLVGLLDYLPLVPIRTAIHLAIPFLPYVRRSPFLRSQMNTDNVDIAYIQRAAYNAVHHLPPALLKQFADWAANDCFRSFDKSVDYQAAVRNIRVPILVVAGRADKLVRPGNARHAYDLLPEGSGKKYVELSKANGFKADYGHIDIIFGRDACAEVLPLVMQWAIDHEPALPA